MFDFDGKPIPGVSVVALDSNRATKPLEALAVNGADHRQSITDAAGDYEIWVSAEVAHVDVFALTRRGLAEPPVASVLEHQPGGEACQLRVDRDSTGALVGRLAEVPEGYSRVIASSPALVAPLQTTVAPTGLFEFDVLPAGSYALALVTDTELTKDIERTDVYAGRATDVGWVTIPRRGDVKLVVLDPDGFPYLDDLKITVHGDSRQHRVARGHVSKRFRDEGDSFLLKGFVPGTLDLRVRGNSILDEATEVQVISGQCVEHYVIIRPAIEQIVLLKGFTEPLVATFYDADGKPVTGHALEFSTGMVRTTARLEPGSYTLQLESEHERFAPIEIIAGETPSPIVLHLSTVRLD